MKPILLLTLISVMSLSACFDEPLNIMPIESLSVQNAISKNRAKYSEKEAQSILDLFSEFKESFKVQGRDCRISSEGPMMALEPSNVISFQSKNKKSNTVSFSLFIMTKDYSVLQMSQEVEGKRMYWTSVDKKMLKNLTELLTVK